MIVGVGIDIVSVERVARAIETFGSGYTARIFTAAELADCAGRADPAESLAARIAAKEACMKALGTGWSNGLSWHQMEIAATAPGAPVLRMSGAAAERAALLGASASHLSLTHQAGLAVAMVLLTDGPGE